MPIGTGLNDVLTSIVVALPYASVRPSLRVMGDFSRGPVKGVGGLGLLVYKLDSCALISYLDPRVAVLRIIRPWS